MKNKRWWLVVVTVVGVSAYWLGMRGIPDYPGSADAMAQQEETVEPEVRRIRAALSEVQFNTASPGVSAAMPAADVPVRNLLEQLETRARGGDASAACRLGVELIRCRKERQQAQIQKVMHAAAQRRDGDATDFEVDLLARMQERIEASEKRCAGIGPEQWQDAPEYQRLAAAHGDARVRLWYVAEPAMDPQFFLDHLEEWARYRAVAQRYLEEAITAGIPEAPAVAARVHWPEDALSVMGVALRRPDEFLYFVHTELDRLLHPAPERIEPLSPGAIDLVRQPGPDIDMARVRAEAERLRQAYFANHVPGPRNEDVLQFVDGGSDPDEICRGGNG